MVDLKQTFRIYWKLFSVTLYLSAVTFGGGFAIIPFMKRKFVDDLHWIEEEEMLNLVAIAQSSPGAVAVNASILLGYKVKGLPGAVTTVFGTILPPLVIISIISVFYTQFRQNVVVNAVLKGMQAGVAAVIIDVVLTLGRKVTQEREISSILIMIGAFIATFVFKVNVVLIILLCGVYGVAKFFWYEHKHKAVGGEEP